MEELFKIAERGDYATALNYMKSGEAGLLEQIKQVLKSDDDDGLLLQDAYEIAMDRATGTFDPGPAAAGFAAAAGPVDPALALQFATLLQNFIIQAGDNLEEAQDLRGISIFRFYEERRRERQAEMYYRQYYEFLKQKKYAAANAFIGDPHNRERVLYYLHLKLTDADEIGFKMNWQEVYDSILDNKDFETADLFRQLVMMATGGNPPEGFFDYEGRQLIKAMGEVSMKGGRKSRRRAKKTRRSVRKNKSRSKGKSICK
jgi:hypothetical protein